MKLKNKKPAMPVAEQSGKWRLKRYLYHKKIVVKYFPKYYVIDSEEELDPEAHKKSLQKLKKIDPDFYNFLEENDENLLNFEADSDENSDKENDDDDSVHVPGPITGDSDESDFEVQFFLILMLS